MATGKYVRICLQNLRTVASVRDGVLMLTVEDFVLMKNSITQVSVTEGVENFYTGV